MHELHSRLAHFAISFALAASSTMTAAVASQQQSTTSEPLDVPASAAERMTREALLQGIAGDTESRDAGLSDALRVDPDCALARWHQGQVRLGDQWLTVDEVERRRSRDTQLEEYRRLRDSASGDARRELGVANWCRRRGIVDAEQLHLRRALASSLPRSAERRRAMDKLGLRNYRGQLLTEADIDRLEAELAKEREDRAKWTPIVEKSRKAIETGTGSRRGKALERLHAIKEPAAISALESLLSARSEDLALVAVAVIGAMPEHEATQSLVRHAVNSRWDSVSAAAVHQLQRRPLHDFAPLVLGELVAPVESRFSVNVGADGLIRHRHEFFREGPLANQQLTHGYVGGPQFVSRSPLSGPSADRDARLTERAYQFREAAQVRRWVFFQEAVRARDLERGVALSNEMIAKMNRRTFEVLEQTTGEKLPRTPLAWWEWWLDYNEVHREQKPTYAYAAGRADPYYLPLTRMTSCFPAGTQVHGETGLVDIERIRPGDRVLSQDPETGKLAYKLVLRTTERPPSELLQVKLDGGSTITTTKGHPFWVNGVGWRMAKRLEAGQQLHSVGGSETIHVSEPFLAAKAYNLVVADFGTYFVSEAAVLVHDNTYRKPTAALTPGLLATTR